MVENRLEYLGMVVKAAFCFQLNPIFASIRSQKLLMRLCRFSLCLIYFLPSVRRLALKVSLLLSYSAFYHIANFAILRRIDLPDTYLSNSVDLQPFCFCQMNVCVPRNGYLSTLNFYDFKECFMLKAISFFSLLASSGLYDKFVQSLTTNLGML